MLAPLTLRAFVLGRFLVFNLKASIISTLLAFDQWEAPMRAVIIGLAAASIIASIATPTRSYAQEEPSYRELPEQVANTSIIWVNDEYRSKNSDMSKVASTFVDKFLASPNNQGKDTQTIGVYQNLGAFAVGLPKAEVDNFVEELSRSDLPEDKALAAGVAVTPDMIVSLFGDENCDDSTAKPLSHIPGGAARFKPPGVERVNGGGNTTSFGKKVWIIDSGLDNISNFITVDPSKAANCTGSRCDPSSTGNFANDLKDENGHGTMLAGIVAAHELIDTNPGNDGDPSIIGVAPGATVIPIKAFRRNPDASFARASMHALEYVLDNANRGDVVNISWGTAWLEGMNRRRNNLETVMGSPGGNPGLMVRLRQLVRDKNLTIAIAAGNTEAAIRPSWVQFVMPAGLGSFPAGGVGCQICTVSAVKSTKSGAHWTDQFWWIRPPGSSSGATSTPGSNYGRNPPDFAEPGVGVLSLWPKGNGSANRINTCSGTSFAAPHLAGIFVRGTPNAEYTVIGDPDSPNDPMAAEPVGVLP